MRYASLSESIFRIAILAFMLAICPGARADQAAWVTKEQADKAATVVRDARQVRLYCPPCGDSRWTPITVNRVEARDTGQENYFEIYINDFAVDLAYTYVPGDGRWQNLATQLGIAVSDVSAVLDDTIKGSLPDYFRAHYRGAISDNLAIRLDLWKEGEDAYGEYVYEGKERPIRITGTIDADGALTLTELVDDKKTGLFDGQFDAEATTAKGQWVNADRSRTLPFTFTRIAAQRVEEKTEKIGGQDLFAYFDFPFFELADKAVAMRLNDAIHKGIMARYDAFVSAVKAAPPAEKPEPAPAGENTPPEPAAEETYDEEGDPSLSISIGEYVIDYFSARFASLRFVVFTYGGGAHPNTFTLTMNLALKSDAPPKALTLRDALAPGDASVKALSEFCIVALKKAGASLVVDGAKKEFTLEEMQNFTIDPVQMTIYFDPYAVASYAEGPFDVTIPLAKLTGTFNRDALASAGITIAE